ncbi:hypothetical protein E2C01_074845 [Portunus trituberculatus]|uniref:Uncharacterized protein n=1 Tax=Portunus trituberculatus TaxID=210409 RepID=A0A5B7I4I5_PORTR|nr:hypothetical protein [Portunus trituberculatus]
MHVTLLPGLTPRHLLYECQLRGNTCVLKAEHVSYAAVLYRCTASPPLCVCSVLLYCSPVCRCVGPCVLLFCSAVPLPPEITLSTPHFPALSSRCYTPCSSPRLSSLRFALLPASLLA